MATAFLLLSSGPDGENPRDDGSGAVSSEICPIPTNPAVAKPKGARKGGGGPAARKRPPQRGFGIAQLERIRVQDTMNTIIAPETENLPETQPVLVHLPSAAVYDRRQQLPLNTVLPGAPVGYGEGSYYFEQLPASYLHLVTSTAAAAGAAPRSALHEQFSMDRYRPGGTAGVDAWLRPVVGNPLAEPPSNQSNLLQYCVSDQYEFYARKKRFFGHDLLHDQINNNGTHYHEMDIAADMEASQKSESYIVGECRTVREFDFFPLSRSASIGSGSCSKLDRTAGDAISSSSSSAAASSHNLLDLSLTLSL